jgi:phosphoribosyl-ATP pyrophosphohydrolase
MNKITNGNEIVTAYKKCKNKRQVCEEYDISYYLLTQLLKANDIENRVRVHKDCLVEPNEEIIEAYKKCKNKYKICEEYDITYFSLTRLLKDNNIDTKKKYSAKTINNIIKLYKKCERKKQVCRKYDITDYELNKILKENDIKTLRVVKGPRIGSDEEIIEAYKECGHKGRVCQRYNITYMMLTRLLDENNISKYSLS